MSAFKVVLPLFLLVVAIAADTWDIDSSEDNLIDDITLDGNESLFNALVIMKNNKESEEIILDSNEVKDIEMVLPHDIAELNRVATQGDEVDTLYIKDSNKGESNSDAILRRKPWRGCLKKASKVCKKACKRAAKDACDYYDCRAKLKRGLKKECNRSCKMEFLGD